MSQQQTPHVSLALVEWLEKLFPDRLPDPSAAISDRVLWAAAGSARVVRKLRQVHEQQTTQALEGK